MDPSPGQKYTAPPPPPSSDNVKNIYHHSPLIFKARYSVKHREDFNHENEDIVSYNI
jgi:hypothetical protein